MHYITLLNVFIIFSFSYLGRISKISFYLVKQIVLLNETAFRKLKAEKEEIHVQEKIWEKVKTKRQRDK